MSTDKKKLMWLDCDPGHDDACAIIMAGFTDNLELLGISTVCGNQTVDKTTINALKICQISGLGDIPVVKGQHKALTREERACPEIHGNSGLDGTEFPVLTKKPVEENVVIFMYKKIMEAPEKVTIVGTAQLTNIALLLIVFPEIKQKIEQIVLLGGAIGLGNISPNAEWNILCDPEAFKLIIESELKVVMIPIEVTHTTLATKAIMDEIRNLNTPFSKLIVELLTFFAKTYKEVFLMPNPPLHDPNAVAYVSQPELYNVDHLFVEVDCSTGVFQGRTSCDVFKLSNKKPNVFVAKSCNVDGFWKKMLYSFKKADEVSPMNKK